MKTLFLVVVLFISSVIKCFSQVPPTEIQNTMQEYLDQFKEALLVQNNIDVPGWMVSVEKVGQWQQTWTSGVADNTTTIPLNGQEKFRIGNSTQLFIGVGVLKLVQNNTLSLSDPISNWLPISVTNLIPNSSSITIKQLLQHTSGIGGYNDVVFINGDPIASEILQDWYSSTFLNNYSFDTIMNDYFTDYAPMANPSNNIYIYSETNYLLLGKIIETSTGLSWQQFIQQAILTPLNLNNTSCMVDSVLTVPSNFMNGYIDTYEDNGTALQIDATIQNNSIYKTSRGMISNLNDLNTFWKSVREYQILPQNLSDLMQTCNAYPDGDTTSFGFGLGCIEPNQGNNWIGNEGLIEGHSSATYYLPNIDAYVSVANNLMQSNAGIVAIAELVIGEYYLNTSEFESSNFSIAPNPAKDIITINSKNEIFTAIEIFDLQGRKIQTFANSELNPTIDVSNLNSGIYILKVKHNQEWVSKKWIKE